jgi:hypothetical protein
MAALLDTPEGIVFVDGTGALLRAEYEEGRWSLTGPVWRVIELGVAHEGGYDCGPLPPLYSDYATEKGREWWENNASAVDRVLRRKGIA